MEQLKFSILILIFIIIPSEMKSIRTIKVMVSQSKPFVFFENHSLKGLEVDIIENFAKRHKINIKYIATNASLKEVFNSDERFNNFSQSTAFPQADIFIGALEENVITNKHLMASRSYYHDTLTWCVQKRQPIPVWKNIFYLCNDLKVYCIFFVLWVLSACILYFCEQFERHPKWDWNKYVVHGISIYTGFPCPYDPKTTANRICFLAISFSAIIYVCTLSSILMHLFLTPILNPQVQSINEIIDENFKLVGDKFTHNKLSEQTEIFSTMNKFDVKDHPDQYLDELRWNDKLAIAISRELSLSRNQTGISHLDSLENVYCFDHPNIIYEYSLSILTQVNFPLINELNRFLERATERGLVDKWLKRYRSFGKEKYKIRYRTLKSESLSMVMAIYFALMSSAFAMVSIERFVYRKVRSGNPKPFWPYAEMTMDPYRYFLLEDLDWAK